MEKSLNEGERKLEVESKSLNKLFTLRSFQICLRRLLNARDLRYIDFRFQTLIVSLNFTWGLFRVTIDFPYISSSTFFHSYPRTRWQNRQNISGIFCTTVRDLTNTYASYAAISAICSNFDCLTQLAVDFSDFYHISSEHCNDNSLTRPRHENIKNIDPFPQTSSPSPYVFIQKLHKNHKTSSSVFTKILYQSSLEQVLIRK